MPLEFTSAGRPVHLPSGTSVQLELNSALFDEDTIKGSFSYSFSVPAAPNGPLYGYPERPDGAAQPGAQLPAELGLDGVPILTGSQRVKSASATKYSVSMQAGLSGANLSERLLRSFSYGGLRQVPRWVLLPGTSTKYPGLVEHANNVVASPGDYDYVFAPLRNEFIPDEQKNIAGFDPKLIDPLDYPYNPVNLWFVYPIPIGGFPAGGSFTYDPSIGGPTGVGGRPYRLLPPYCPFPRLRYVLQAICEESGLAVDKDNLLPGELGELVLVSNAWLVDRGDTQTLRFSLADVVPELTVAQLLAAIRQDLGVVVYQEPATGRVRSRYLVEQVAPAAPYTDLSTRLAGTPEVSIEAETGLTLTAHVDSADELTKELLTQQPDPTLLLEAVDAVALLPATAVPLTENPQLGQVRLVRDLDTFYSITAITYLDGVNVSLTWSPLVVRLASVQVNGGGQEQAQANCYTATRPTRFGMGPDATILLPAISQPPFRADDTSKEAVSRSSELRLLFYNGLQLATDGVSTYPQLAEVSASGAYSLRLSGPTGTYAQWLAMWLPVKLRATSYKQPLLLTPLDLSRLDLTQPLRLAGVPYLVRKLSVALPLTKPASVELVRLF
jgi:hypothetical protein